MKSFTPAAVEPNEWTFTNPWNTPIPNDYFGVHTHRWPINQQGTVFESPEILNYDWFRTTDSAFGYWQSLHFKINSLVRIGNTVTLVVFLLPEQVDFTAINNPLFNTGETISIVGANEPGFNGDFIITKIKNVITGKYDLTYTSSVSGNATATTSSYLRFFNWTSSDAVYNQIAVVENKKILYTFLGTPKWAAARPFGPAPYGGNFSMSEPSDMAYFIEFCQALANRYPLILHYEVGNEPSWGYYINAKSVLNDEYSITVELFNTPNFDKIQVGCTVECKGISKQARITNLVKENYVCTITFNLPKISVVSDDLYVSKYYYRNVIGYSRNSVSSNVTLTLNSTEGIVATDQVLGFIAGTNIYNAAIVSSNTSNTVTYLDKPTSLGSVTGDVMFFTEGPFINCFPQKLAELTRIAKLAIKAVRPTAKILIAPTSNFVTMPRVATTGIKVLPSINFYVNPNGNDTWSGTLQVPNITNTDGPFSTIEKAQLAIRALKVANKFTDPINVNLSSGTYYLSQTLMFTASDSGAADKQIVWQGEPNSKVIISGGIPLTGIQRDATFWDCAVTQLPVSTAYFDTGRIKGNGPKFELFVNDQRMQLARWPNTDWAHIKLPLTQNTQFSVMETLPTFTGNTSNAQVHIIAGNDWFDQYLGISSIDPSNNSISLASSTGYNIESGRRFYIQNIASLLDSPSEWFYDTETQNISFIPPVGIRPAEVIISSLANILIADNISNVTFKNITIKHSTGTAVIIKYCSDVVMDNLNIKNIGGKGIDIFGTGRLVHIINSEIQHTGAHGITVSGGIPATLEACGHLIHNTHIHHVSRVLLMYTAAIEPNGIGVTMSNNLLEYGNSNAILFTGNDHVIENNEIHHFCLQAGDCGAIYAGRNWTWRGNIIRDNYIHDIIGYSMISANTATNQVVYSETGAVGIYLDDGISGVLISGNLLENAGWLTIQINAGRDNTILNNIIITDYFAIVIDTLWPTYNWAPLREGLAASPYLTPIWQQKYPALSVPMNNEQWPENNTIERNIFITNTKSNLQRLFRYQIPQESTIIANNVVWATTGSPTVQYRILETNIEMYSSPWSQWVAKGVELGSVVADPLVSIAHNPLSVNVGQPAITIGFVPFTSIVSLITTSQSTELVATRATYGAPIHWECSAEGYPYLGDSGIDTRAIDHVDILAQHTYGHNEFNGFLGLKSYASSLGYPDIDIWSTEFGTWGMPYVGGIFQSEGSSYNPNWITTNSTSKTVTIHTSGSIDYVNNGKWLYDIGGNKLGFVIESDLTLKTLTLSENAYKTYSGRGVVLQTIEKQEQCIRYIVSAAAVGFKKAFFYASNDGVMGITDDSYSSRVIATAVNSIKGKTVMMVDQPRKGSPLTIHFNDGTSLNTGDVLNPYPVRDHCITDVTNTIAGKTAGDNTQKLFTTDLNKPQFCRNLNNILRTVDLTAIAAPINYSFPDGTHSITSISGSGSVVTIVSNNASYEVKTFIEIAGCNISQYNGTYKVVSSSGTTFTTTMNHTATGTPTQTGTITINSVVTPVYATIKQIAAITITSVTTSSDGLVATINYTKDGVIFANGDPVVLTGMDPHHYNARYIVQSGTVGSFTVNLRPGVGNYKIGPIATFGTILSGAYGTRGCTAISPRHVISANHYHPLVTSDVYFVDRVIGDYYVNKTYKRTIISEYNITGTDIWIGYLDSALPASIMPMTIYPEDFRTYIRQADMTAKIPVYYSFHGRADIHVADWYYYDSNNLLGGSDLNHCLIQRPSDASKLPWYLWNGGSSSPVFSVIDNVPVLLFTLHYGVGDMYGGPMVAGHITEINAAMASMNGNMDYQLVTKNLSNFTKY